MFQKSKHQETSYHDVTVVCHSQLYATSVFISTDPLNLKEDCARDDLFLFIFVPDFNTGYELL